MSFTAERIHLGGKLTATTWPEPKYDEYWKLVTLWPLHTEDKKALLERRGYATGANTNPEWLRESLIRSSLGQMSYVPYSNAQLRELIAARRIDATKIITKRSKGLRKELIQLLDQADQNPRFTKFRRLPPELRNRVYQMYFADFTQPLQAPIQPPITFTGSQVRKETLQMFYSTCQFGFVFINQPRAYSHARSLYYNNRLTLPPATLLWFHRLSNRSLSSMRRFRFEIVSNRQHQRLQTWRGDANFGSGCLGWFELDIVRTVGGLGRMELFFPHSPMRYAPTAHLIRVRLAIELVVLKISARIGKVCLTADDLKALRKAMEAWAVNGSAEGDRRVVVLDGERFTRMDFSKGPSGIVSVEGGRAGKSGSSGRYRDRQTVAVIATTNHSEKVS